LIVREWDFADLAMVDLSSYLHEKLEGQEFTDVNQVMQRDMAQENHARDNRSSSRFRDHSKEKDRSSVRLVEESLTSDEDAEICMAEWVDTPKGKPMTCPFLKPEPGKKGEMKFTFDISKCEKLFDVLLQNNIVKLKGGHVIPSTEQLARRKYCKWHDSFSHTTNECNYFHRQIQLALNDSRLTLGDGQRVRLDVDPFPVNMINIEEKRVLVCTDQAESTKGKKVLVSNQLKLRMMKPKNPEAGVWKENVQKKARREWQPTSSFLMEKYARQRQRSVFDRLGGYKRKRSPMQE
jgi:hypothetical protein